MSFVTTSGTKFMLNGQIWRPFGGSIYGSTGTTALMKSRVDDAVSCNFTMLRIINYIGGTPAQFYDGTNEAAWARVDYLLDYASQKGIKILIDCSDYCGALLGVPTTPANQDWTAYLTFLLNRVNTVNGKVYKNDDTIAMFTIAGEISPTYASETVTFYTNVSSLFKSLGASQIINTGGVALSHPWNSICAISTIDCISNHDYTYRGANSVVTNFPTYAQYSQANNKPWFIEEFGNQSQVGDNNFSLYMHNYYKIGLYYGCAGFMFWNFYPSSNPPGGTDYNIGPGGGLPLTNQIVKTYSYVKSYTPRIPVDAAISGGLT